MCVNKHFWGECPVTVYACGCKSSCHVVFLLLDSRVGTGKEN